MINEILTGDARELAKQIPDCSVDFILTDPVYQKVEDYEWLASLAMRVLKPDRAVLAFQSTRWCADAQKAMERVGLTYQWTLYYTIPGKPGAMHLYGIYPCTTPVLYFAKGRTKASPYIPDTLIGIGGPDNEFKWQKNEWIIGRYLEVFSNPGDIVLDPFSGSGTISAVCKKLSRNYIAFEIDEQRAAAARERVATTPMPLFVLEPEQSKFDLESA